MKGSFDRSCQYLNTWQGRAPLQITLVLPCRLLKLRVLNPRRTAGERLTWATAARELPLPAGQSRVTAFQAEPVLPASAQSLLEVQDRTREADPAVESRCSQRHQVSVQNWGASVEGGVSKRPLSLGKFHVPPALRSSSSARFSFTLHLPITPSNDRSIFPLSLAQSGL